MLEFNARMGDPEAQVLLETLGDQALALFEEIAGGTMEAGRSLSSIPRVGVVLASAGYPENPVLGDPVEGLPKMEDRSSDSTIYFAGVARKGGALVTSGGRVLTAVGRGESLLAAREASYRLIKSLRLSGGQYRSDIALRDAGGG